MPFQPVFNNFATRPTTASLKHPVVGFHAIVRDQFTIPTWLLLGALIQGAASALLPYRNIVLVLPLLLVLGYKISTTVLTLAGVLKNPRMEGVIPYRTSIVLPTEKGLPEQTGESGVCAIALSVISNHPLGMFGPGFKEVGDRFEEMVKELSNDATRHGFLGASSWLNAADRATSSEYMSILYFENEHYLHTYAHGPMHSDATRWWRETEKKHGHVGIMHEVFACPKRTWEGIYLNYHPIGLGSTTKEVTDMNGRKSWVSPLVKARGNKFLFSKGRMGRGVGENEWDSVAATQQPE